MKFWLLLVPLALAAADLHPVADRKPAPPFKLHDASGKAVTLKNYRGKILLLDFWATWCTGCKQEIPWFVELQKSHRQLAVVGVSMDEGGWPVLKPFLAEHPIPYRMLLGDKPTAGRFGIEALPDTFLIDRHGRIAAAYIASLVDKDNLSANVESLLSER